MNILVSGGGGFIGSHLIDALLKNNVHVFCADRLAFDSTRNIDHLLNNVRFTFIRTDLSVQENADSIFENYKIDMVYHLAANCNIQMSGRDPEIDFRDTLLTTHCILEGMRKHGVKKLFFASTSAVYGNHGNVALTEETGGIKPVSYYGGAKLASEALIDCYAAMNDMSCVVFRFPNVVGPRLTHGVIFDFIKKLRAEPKRLEIFGDGTQYKPYIYITDLVDCIMNITASISSGVEFYNIGVKGATTVTHIAEAVVEKMKLENVSFEYTRGNIGWKGDVPHFAYDDSKILKTGWKPVYSSDQAVEKTIEEVIQQ